MIDVVRLLADHPEQAQRVAERRGVSVTRLWQQVLHTIDDPEVVAAAPIETARLRRLRGNRRDARSGSVD